jgi:hypothetical protein
MEFAKEFLQQVIARAGDLTGILSTCRAYIVDHFGHNGLMAAYVLLGVVGFVVVYRLIKISIAAIKYVVIPAVVLAFLATMLLPYPFTTVLPVTVTGCSLLLLVKG